MPKNAQESSSGPGEKDQGLAVGIDAIQARYGWRDEEVLALPYARFIEVLDVIREARGQEQEEQMQMGSFIAWQIYASTPRPKGSKGPIGFRSWLQKLHLLPANKTSTEQARAQAIRAVDKVRKAFNRGSR